MIFKAYDNDLEGLSNKLGFSKRTFAEWGHQVKQSFLDGENAILGFKNAIKTAFIVPKEIEKINLIPETDFSSLFDLNASAFFDDFNKRGSTSVETLTNFCDKLNVTDDNMRSYLVDCMQKQVPASYEEYCSWTNKAIESTKQMTLGAKAASLGMKALSIAGNMALFAFASWGISKAFEGIDNLIHKEEKAQEKAKAIREASTGRTNVYKEEKASLDDTISRYKELNNQLTATSVTSEEYAHIRAGLSSLQDDLVTKYGEEASAIDIVNGKYDDQIKKLDALGRKKAQDYLDENIGNIYSDKNFLEETTSAETGITQRLPLGNLPPDIFEKINAPFGAYQGTREEIRKQIQEDIAALKGYYGDTNEEINDYVLAISDLLNSENLSSAAISQSRQNLTEFAKASLEADPDAYRTYEDLTKAVENYNTALETGKGVDKAKSDLDRLNIAFENATSDITGIGYIYDQITDKINRPLEIESNLLNLSKSKASVKKYLSALNGLESKDLSDIDYNEAVNSVSGITAETSIEAFGQLINLLGISEDEIQTLIDLLVQLGYVQDSVKVQNIQNAKNLLGYQTTVNNATDAAHNQVINDFLAFLSDEDLSLILDADIPKESLKWTKEQYEAWLEELRKDSTIDVRTTLDPTKALSDAGSAFSGLEGIYEQINSGKTVPADSINGLTDSFGSVDSGIPLQKFKDTLITMPGDIDAQKKALDDLATAYLDNTGLLQNLTEENKDYVKSELKKIGVTNADEFINTRLSKSTGKLLEKLKEFSSVFADNSNALKTASDDSEEYTTAVSNIKAGLEDLFSYELDGEKITPSLSDKFVTNNMGDIEKAASGSIEALNRLRVEASKDIVANMEINAPAGAMEEGIRQHINSLIDGIDLNSIEIGTSLNDTPLIRGLQHLVDAGQITQKSMNSILSGIGVEPEKYDQTVYIETPETGIRNGHVVVTGRSKVPVTIPAISYKVSSKTAGAHYSAPSYSPSGGSGGGGVSSSSASGASDTSKEYDWISVGIKRCEDALAKLRKAEENTYSGWSSRNRALNDEISRTAKELSYLQNAYSAYMSKADSIGLSDTYKRKVQNGTIQLENIKDENLREKIDAYQDWYDKAQDIRNQIDDLNHSLSELARLKFDNIVSKFEDIQSIFTGTGSMLEASIGLAEAKGRIISRTYYKELLKNEQKNYSSLIKQRDAMQASLNEAVSSGQITVNSEAWYELCNRIQEVNKAIIESGTSIEEFRTSIREADWEIFDLMQEKISDTASEIEFMNSILENSPLTDGSTDTGLTKEGNAQMGNHAAMLNIYMEQARQYGREIKKINSEIAKDPYNMTLLERKQDLLDAQQDSILAAKEERQAMIDLAKDGYDAVLDTIQSTIDKKKELLQSEKNLYEYEKSIAEKTGNIASLQKQKAVYENDSSEEAKKKLQQISLELEEAQQDLKETEYDRYISDQEEALDRLYSEYSDKIDGKFKDTDALIAELLNATEKNSGEIKKTLSDAAKKAGYTMSNELSALWNGSSGSSVQNILAGIKDSIDRMTSVIQSEADKAIAEAKNNAPANPGTGNSTTTTPDGILLTGNMEYTAPLLGTPDNRPLFELNGDAKELILSSIMNSNTARQIPLSTLSIPDLKESKTVGDLNLNIGSINLPNVTRPEEFSDAFITAMKQDTRIVRAMHSVTTDVLAGKSTKRLNNI